MMKQKTTYLTIIFFIAICIITTMVSCGENPSANETGTAESQKAEVTSAFPETPMNTAFLSEKSEAPDPKTEQNTDFSGTMSEVTQTGAEVTEAGSPTEISSSVKLTATPTTAKPKTSTPAKTTTAKPTATSKPPADVYKTITYEGKTYKVLMGRNGNPYLIKDRTTLPQQLQPYVYPYDIEGIRKDVTLYAKSQGMTNFWNPQSFMTAELINKCSWDNPDQLLYHGDKVYDEDEDELDAVIYRRKYVYQSGVDYYAIDLNKKGLSFWFKEVAQSKTNLWNGQPTKQYFVYWIYGMGVDIEPNYNP